LRADEAELAGRWARQVLGEHAFATPSLPRTSAQGVKQHCRIIEEDAHSSDAQSWQPKTKNKNGRPGTTHKLKKYPAVKARVGKSWVHDGIYELTFEEAVTKLRRGEGQLNPYTITDAATVKDRNNPK
jgi:hypothetical protein